MSIPEKASMAPPRTDTPSARELLKILADSFITMNKTLNYLNGNLFEIRKGLDNVERAIDANSKAR